jgi:hypothetical protein
MIEGFKIAMHNGTFLAYEPSLVLEENEWHTRKRTSASRQLPNKGDINLEEAQ